MNVFGHAFRLQIFGESHGKAVGLIIDGCPSGLHLDQKDFADDLSRRRGGMQSGTTSRQEEDSPQFISGIFNSYTTGAPITMMFGNKDVRSSDYEKTRAIPRPGHADFAASVKAGGFEDYRGGGHYSGRLSVALVAAGVVAKKLLRQVYDAAIACEAHICEVGGEKDIAKGLARAVAANDSVGGIIECTVKGLPAGIGEPFFNSVESLISHLVFSIPAVKGIEFGSGFKAATLFGSEHNDALENNQGKTRSNNAGGINGGLTNGNDLIFRVAFKPTSSTPRQQESFNMSTGEMESFRIDGRHDLCIALRAPVIIEAASCCVLADLMLQSALIPRVLSAKKISGS